MSDQIKQLILQTLRENGKLSRSQISKLLNIPRTTIYDNLALPRSQRGSQSLLQMGLVCKSIYNNGNRGRPIVFYEVVQ